MIFKILLKCKTNLSADDCKMDMGINNCNYMNTAMNLKLELPPRKDTFELPWIVLSKCQLSGSQKSRLGNVRKVIENKTESNIMSLYKSLGHLFEYL